MSVKNTKRLGYVVMFAGSLLTACAADVGAPGDDQRPYDDENATEESDQELGEASQALTPAAGCVDRTYSGRQYRWCSQFLTWEQARDRCRSYGLDLVRVQSAGENSFVANVGLAFLPRWIGASDLSTEGTWRWSAGDVTFFQGTAFDGGPIGGAYENFPSWEPVLGGDTLDCANIRPYTSGAWYTTSCGEASTFVCEQL